MVEYFPGSLFFDGDAYETPLGTIQLNKIMTEKLTGTGKLIFKEFWDIKQSMR